MSREKKARPERRRSLLRALVAVVLALLVFTVAVTLPLRWLAPPTSSFMIRERMARGGSSDPDGPVRYWWVGWEEIAPTVPIAAVASEDQKFPDHFGFDFKSIAKALEENAERSRPRGASTISQQVAKNLYLWPDRSLLRKGLEAYLTVFIEASWPKRRILEIYLNIAEFGRGVFGVGAASELFFGKPAAELSLDEAALLVAALPSPWRLSVTSPSPYLRERAAQIKRQVRLLGGPAYLAAM